MPTFRNMNKSFSLTCAWRILWGPFLLPRPAGVGTCLPRVLFNLVNLNCQEALWDTELSLGAGWQSPPVFFHQDKTKNAVFKKCLKIKCSKLFYTLYYYHCNNVIHGFLHLFCATVPLRPFWLWCHNLYLVIINIGPTTKISLGCCYLFKNQWQMGGLFRKHVWKQSLFLQFWLVMVILQALYTFKCIDIVITY